MRIIWIKRCDNLFNCFSKSQIFKEIAHKSCNITWQIPLTTPHFCPPLPVWHLLHSHCVFFSFVFFGNLKNANYVILRQNQQICCATVWLIRTWNCKKRTQKNQLKNCARQDHWHCPDSFDLLHLGSQTGCYYTLLFYDGHLLTFGIFFLPN